LVGGKKRPKGRGLAREMVGGKDRKRIHKWSATIMGVQKKKKKKWKRTVVIRNAKAESRHHAIALGAKKKMKGGCGRRNEVGGWEEARTIELGRVQKIAFIREGNQYRTNRQ